MHYEFESRRKNRHCNLSARKGREGTRAGKGQSAFTDSWEVIANRIYYAAYYAVSALLIANGHPAVKGHDTIVRMFGLYFVKTGKFSPEQGKLYNKLYTLRLTGDYNDHYNLEEEDVLPLVSPAEELIANVSTMARQSLENL